MYNMSKLRMYICTCIAFSPKNTFRNISYVLLSLQYRPSDLKSI